MVSEPKYHLSSDPTDKHFEPFTTDAWGYLNIYNPVCAWAAHRGVLVSAPTTGGFVSVWTASLFCSDDHARIQREILLEQVRRREFPHRISRLTGMYCFTDLKSAERALCWGNPQNHFRPEFLVEYSLAEAVKAAQLDANWLSYSSNLQDDEWPRRYWTGEPYPDNPPIWETLVTGRIYILGTELRNKSRELIEKHFPKSVALAETARLAAWAGADLGNTCGFLFDEGENVRLRYLCDMREATDPGLISKLIELRESGNAVITPALLASLKIGAFHTPNFVPFEYTRPKGSMPLI